MAALNIDPQTYYGAAKTLEGLADSINGSLSTLVKSTRGTDAMAGSTNDTKQWASTYDSNATTLVDTTGTFLVAVSHFASLVQQAGFNHATTNYQANNDPNKKAPQQPTAIQEYSEVCWVEPPSAGGPEKGLETAIPNLLEDIGIPVPDGDTGKLHTASGAWNAFANDKSISQATATIDQVLDSLATVNSPEMVDIVGHLATLRNTAADLADTAATMAKNVQTHSDGLDTLRKQMGDILNDLQNTIEMQLAITIFVNLISAGAGLVMDAAEAIKFADTIRSAASKIGDAIKLKYIPALEGAANTVTDSFVGAMAKLREILGLQSKTIEAEEDAASAASSGTDWTKISGIIKDASKGKGNYGVGDGTMADADAAGKAWVGPNAHLASDGKTWVSDDGLRQYRPPSYKPNLGRWQSNLEWRNGPQGQWQGNGHLNITDPP